MSFGRICNSSLETDENGDVAFKIYVELELCFKRCEDLNKFELILYVLFVFQGSGFEKFYNFDIFDILCFLLLFFIFFLSEPGMKKEQSCGGERSTRKRTVEKKKRCE